MQRVDGSFDGSQRQTTPIAVIVVAVKVRRPRFSQSGLEISLKALWVEVEWQAQAGATRGVEIRHATNFSGAARIRFAFITTGQYTQRPERSARAVHCR